MPTVRSGTQSAKSGHRCRCPTGSPRPNAASSGPNGRTRKGTLYNRRSGRLRADLSHGEQTWRYPNTTPPQPTERLNRVLLYLCSTPDPEPVSPEAGGQAMSDQVRFVTLTPTEVIPSVGSNLVVLGYDSWDDWFEFETKYNAFFFDHAGARVWLGDIKIGQAGQKQRRAPVPREFVQLPEEFFSVALSEDYYKALAETGRAKEVLDGLNDLAANLDLFERFKAERVVTVSLFRTIDGERIQNKFHRLASGDAELTRYSFEYVLDTDAEKDDGVNLTFEVEPYSRPPSNIHTLIGRNGVGKTTLLNNIARSYIDRLTTGMGAFSADPTSTLRLHSNHGGGSFANLISVTFSAFDPFFTESLPTTGRYSYIGLKESLSNEEERRPKSKITSYRVKSPDDLTSDFIEAGLRCLNPVKRKRWKSALRNLTSDPIFEESEIVELSEEPDDSDEWTSEAARVFRRLSSGHKIVLLTITRLVELVEEQSLILLDEPESHLHPPLLSAFIRTLSELLTAQNGVALIATHSPVVLQETPKGCAWILDRSGSTTRARRPVPETFGENIGRLTHEVFGLEVAETGFYEVLREAAKRQLDYDGVVSEFNGQLGTEARAILHALLPSKKARVR